MMTVRCLLWLSILALVTPEMLAAQGANVDVTVLPQASVGQPPPSRAGFTVCIGTSADYDQYGTETTPSGGVANQNFRNLPVGAQAAVTINKAGYTGVRVYATLQADWNNHVQATLFPGSGGVSCPSTATSTPPAPAPVPPPASASVNATTSIPITAYLTIGNGNTSRVQANVEVPVVASFIAAAPTDVRLSERADFLGATWKPVGQPLTYTFTSPGSRTLYVQGRIGSRLNSPLTTTASDRVEVVGFSTSGVKPIVVGKPGTESHRLECANGNPMAAMIGRKGLWIDAIGIRCPGSVTLGPVGGPGGSSFTIWDVSECALGQSPATAGIDFHRYQSPIQGVFVEALFVLDTFACFNVPIFGFAPRQAVAATGRDCPANSVPVGIDVYLSKAINGEKSVSGVGLICVTPGS